MKSTEERLKKAALGAGCLFLALGAFEMQSHAMQQMPHPRCSQERCWSHAVTTKERSMI